MRRSMQRRSGPRTSGTAGGHLPLKDLYVGAAAVIWALDALRRRGHASTSLDLAAAALRTLELFRDEPDADRDEHYHPAALLLGETGPLLVACRVAAGAPHADDLYALLPTSVANPTDDIMWGVPGALLARALRAGGPRSPRTRTLLSGAGETAAENSCSGDSGSAATRRRCVD